MPTPLTSTEKTIAIMTLVIGAFIVLVTLVTVASTAYVLTTGKPFGSDLSKSMGRLGGKDPRMEDMMAKQLAAQAEVQTKWAVPQLAIEGAYLAAVLAAMVSATLLLMKGTAKRMLGWLSLAAAAVRLGVGVITYLLTSELMKASMSNLVSTLPQKGGQLSQERAESLSHMASGVSSVMGALSASCMTFVMCGFFGVVAYVCLSPKKAVAG